MKRKIIASHIFFISALAGIVFTCLMSYNTWFIAGFLVMAFLSSAFSLKTWMTYVTGLVAASNKILNKKEEEKSTWSFDNLEKLQQNHELVAKKFKLSAEMISNLSNPETIGTTNDLFVNDSIGIALQNIRAEMLRIKDEDDKRAWVVQGLAKFGEVLRNKLEMKEYGHHIISNLVKYIGANQAGLFMEGENPDGGRCLDLVACYAYGKRKYVEGRILEGEGLLGQCMLEKDFIFITDVPKTYAKITSGLGEATPRNIIVAPLIFNDTFCGLIELASFEILKPHQVEFLKKVCENIASEMASLKSMKHTQVLLQESNTLTLELQSREEEMKQNMEELAATQEEMVRKQTELAGIISAIDSTLATAEFDLTGNFKNANDIFLKVMGYKANELTGRDFKFFMGADQTMSMMWANLKLGKFFSGEFKMKDKTGKELWLTGTFNPIIIQGKVPDKIMMFAQFTTQEKEKLHDLNEMAQVLKNTIPVIEFNEHFVSKTANEKALKILGISRMELRNKTILDFIAPCYREAWLHQQPGILKHELSNLVVPVQMGSQVSHFEVSFSLIKNLDDKPARVIMILGREVQEPVSILAVAG